MSAGSRRSRAIGFPRVLFVLSSLPQRCVSIDAIEQGRLGVSGSHLSSFAVANGLARRGHPIAIVVLDGGTILDSAVRFFDDLEEAMKWCGENGKVVWCSWGDAGTLDALHSVRCSPWMWLHTDMERRYLRWLERDMISGIVTVSDSSRLPALHSSQSCRIGRIYNPLARCFLESEERDSRSYSSRTLVFSGFLGESKGAHRVFQMWPHVREQFPDARLIVAGSGRLYGDGRPLGSFGMASPDFEERYLRPVVGRFGSFEAAGIQMLGLVAPLDLREVYGESALGIVNPNWNSTTETFCCAAIEMLSTQLPVFGVARGALPETIGGSGGAFLTRSPALHVAAAEVASLLKRPRRLEEAGRAGQRFVRLRYDMDTILKQWEALLRGEADDLHASSGRWRDHRGARYWIETVSGRLRIGRVLEAAIDCARIIRRPTS